MIHLDEGWSSLPVGSPEIIAHQAVGRDRQGIEGLGRNDFFVQVGAAPQEAKAAPAVLGGAFILHLQGVKAPDQQALAGETRFVIKNLVSIINNGLIVDSQGRFPLCFQFKDVSPVAGHEQGALPLDAEGRGERRVRLPVEGQRLILALESGRFLPAVVGVVVTDQAPHSNQPGGADRIGGEEESPKGITVLLPPPLWIASLEDGPQTGAHLVQDVDHVVVHLFPERQVLGEVEGNVRGALSDELDG